MLDDDLIRDYDATRHPGTDKGVVCHAPFVNLNFEQNGNATACCYNRTHVLGTYPDASVDEIWNGAAAESLRAAIRERDFTKGCELCLVQLQSRNFTGTRMRHFDPYAAAPHGAGVARPRVMEFELTNTCNLECVMCNGYYSSLIRKRREHAPPLRSPYDMAFVEQLEPYLPDLMEAKFLGGEPFLINIYHEIWDRMLRLAPQATVVVTTNGTILTEKVRGLLDEMDFRVVLSIDSIERNTYEQIRKNASYDEVMTNLRFFLEYMQSKNEILGMTVCPMQQNWRELPEMIRFCNRNRIRIFFNTVLYPSSCSLRDLDGPALDEVLTCFAEASLEGDEEWQRHNAGCFQDLVHQLEEWRRIAEEKDAVRASIVAGAAQPIDPAGWSLALQDDARARLARDADSERIRVEIETADAEVPWRVQAAQSGIRLVGGHRYCVSFRVRADAPRTATVVVAQDHDPWGPLGLYQEIEIAPEWETRYLHFIAMETTDRGRLYLDLGGHAAAVEIDEAVIVEGGGSATSLFEARYPI